MKLLLRDLPNLGIAEVQLDKKLIDELWTLIDKAKKNKIDERKYLAGNISLSLKIEEASILNPVLQEVVNLYEQKYGQGFHSLVANAVKNNFLLNSIWVNFQHQNEFNPIHDHSGGYSFVIWMKIPTEYEDQKKLDFVQESGSDNLVSNFAFVYSSILGDIKQSIFPMGKEMEGKLVLFPSRLKHIVYPFYNCDEPRITIAGNLSVTQD